MVFATKYMLGYCLVHNLDHHGWNGLMKTRGGVIVIQLMSDTRWEEKITTKMLDSVAELIVLADIWPVPTESLSVPKDRLSRF